jgi:hypothetical protein
VSGPVNRDGVVVFGRKGAGPFHLERGLYGRAWCGVRMRYRHSRFPNKTRKDVTCGNCLATLRRASKA